jgi:hypothetical protein
MSSLTSLTDVREGERLVLPKRCNQSEVVHLCKIEWHQMEDLEGERNYNPVNQKKYNG